MKKLLLIVALAVFSQGIMADEMSLLERFEVRWQDEETAAVRARQKLPQSLQKKACRLQLSSPLRGKLRQQLADHVGFPIADSVSYFQGEINGEQMWRDDDWQYCRGKVTLTDEPANLANLAVRAAWTMASDLDQVQLKSLLSLSLSHQGSSADAVSLIAFLAPSERQLTYLDNNLKPEHLTLNVAQLAAAKIYFDAQRWQTTLTILKQCSTLECRRLQLQAEQEKEKQDANKAFDLGNYFSG